MIRNVGFLSWKQPSAWMEKMSGKRWDTMVKKENKLFMDTVREVSSEEEILSKSEEFHKANGSMFFSYSNIIIQVQSSYEYIWFYVNSKKRYTVSDLSVDGSDVYHVYDIGNGAQTFRVECIKDGNREIEWSKDNVGSQVYVYNNICYVLGVSKKLWYNSLIALDAKTGKVIKTLYEEKDGRYNLRIMKGENALFLIRESSGTNNFFIVKGLILHYIESIATSFYPIGYHKGQNNLCYLENINNIWKPVGFKLKETFSNSIEYFSLQHEIYILRDYGLKRVFDLKGKELYNFYGNMLFHPFIYKKSIDKFYIDFTESSLEEFTFEDKFIKSCNVKYCNVKRIFCISNDGTKVAYLLAKPFCDIKGLMVIGYGAYGIETSLSTRRWIPYLHDGWLLCFAMVRGSGDVDAIWSTSARTVEKVKSCEDFEACIKDVQTKHNISAEKTCIYGRSAGGYLVGMATSRNPNGRLFKMVYAEVPYVDVLRTTTNPNLPLTVLEYEEFGNPAKSIYEFEKILEVSPIDSLDTDKPPDLNIIIRTSENDSQVYPYESYKWLYALRGRNYSDTTKLLYNTEKKGHFVNGRIGYTHYSEDFFLLNNIRDNAAK